MVATSVHEGICDAAGRLSVEAARFFGMIAGSGEFYTLGRKVGQIGQTVHSVLSAGSPGASSKLKAE